jgi:(p)ppGpp synthase/HD superfamily hydrolase
MNNEQRRQEMAAAGQAIITQQDVYDARLYATAAHEFQKRKVTREPYINHCEAVVSIVHQWGGSDIAMCAGWLHDVVEDTDATIDWVARRFGVDVATVVDALTRRVGEERKEYLKRVAADRAALLVKRADLTHNAATANDVRAGMRRMYEKDHDYLLRQAIKVGTLTEEQSQPHNWFPGEMSEQWERAISDVAGRIGETA